MRYEVFIWFSLVFRSPKWEKLHSQGAPLHETKELKVTLKNVKSKSIVFPPPITPVYEVVGIGGGR